LGAQGRAGHINGEGVVAQVSHQGRGLGSLLLDMGWAMPGQQGEGVLGR
jgi:hypothetical protein